MIPASDEIHFAQTTDGWRLALHRYHPRLSSLGGVVILCGGYACNRYFLDYDDERSLARFLARHGFDAWVLELRGRGMSHPAPTHSSPGTWTFDDFAERDAPAAIEYVARMTGRDVCWVGHSMGGLVAYAYAGLVAPGTGRLRAVATLASPVSFPNATPRVLSQLGLFALSVPFSDTIHQRWPLGVLWNLLGHSSALTIGMNPANVDHGVVGRALRLSLGNVSRVKLRQLARWAHDGSFCSSDGSRDYLTALRSVTIPMLVIAGSADRVATPEAVRRVLDYLSSSAVTYLEMGAGCGHSVDYGHVDLVLGRRAPREVFPIVARWLAVHASETSRPRLEGGPNESEGEPTL